MGLTCVLLHNIYIEKGDMITRNIDLSFDLSTNKRRPQNDLRELLQMTNISQRYLGNIPADAKRVRDFICPEFWEEKQLHEYN